MDKAFYQPIIDKISSWGTTALEMLPNFLIALLVLAVFIFAAKWIKKGARKLLGKTYENQELSKMISKIVYITVIAVGAMFALSVLHLDKTVSSILAGAGIIGLALSFAFQDLAANFVSGFFMAAKRPFEVGDVIEVEGYIGTVLNINLRNTEILSFDGNEILLPNRLLFENPLTNYYKTKTRRVDLEVGVSYAEDLDRVEEITRKAIAQLPELIQSEDIQVIFKDFGGSSINLEVRYWVPYSTYFQYLKGQSDGVKLIKKAYDENNISIPFPITTLDFGIKGGKSLSTSLQNQIEQVEKN